MEDFVTFELAKKLKEKGFDCSCIGHYVNNQLYIAHYLNAFHSDKDESLDAPTISQVSKWLREEKEIDILLQPIFLYNVLYNETSRERKYGIKIYAPQLNKPTHMDYFKNWEKGAIAGIEYVLDNLI